MLTGHGESACKSSVVDDREAALVQFFQHFNVYSNHRQKSEKTETVHTSARTEQPGLFCTMSRSVLEWLH